jgi:hypothetical protein
LSAIIRASRSRVGLLERAVRPEAGVVHQKIDPNPPPVGLFLDPRDVRLVRQIRGDHLDACPVPAPDLVGERVHLAPERATSASAAMPRAASRRAIAAPMPRDAPVTSAARCA